MGRGLEGEKWIGRGERREVLGLGERVEGVRAEEGLYMFWLWVWLWVRVCFCFCIRGELARGRGWSWACGWYATRS